MYGAVPPPRHQPIAPRLADQDISKSFNTAKLVTDNSGNLKAFEGLQDETNPVKDGSKAMKAACIIQDPFIPART